MPDLNPNIGPFISVVSLCQYDVTASLHPDVWTAWSSYSESVTAVFPNLSHIRWAVKDHADSQLALDLLMPSLCGLTLACLRSSMRDGHEKVKQVSAALDILRSAINTFPQLQNLVLFGKCPLLSTYDLSPMATFSWPSLQHLRTFHCGERLPSSIMRHIASISSLQSFIGYPYADTSFQNLPRVFPAILELQVLGTSLRHTCDLVSAVQSPSIRILKLSLAASGQLNARRAGDLLQVIAGHPSSQSLRELVIKPFSESGLGHIAGTPENLALSDIRPSLGIRHLRHINLTCFIVAGEGADDIALEMLDAWPELEELYLGGQSQIHISMGDFVEALRARPTLRRVPFRVVLRPGETVPETHGFIHHNLTGMTLDQSCLPTIHDRAIMAQFLNATFPNLEQYGVRTDRSIKELIWAGQNARLAGRPWTLDEYEAYLLQSSDGSWYQRRHGRM
jgi:hypothetical protein